MQRSLVRSRPEAFFSYTFRQICFVMTRVDCFFYQLYLKLDPMSLFTLFLVLRELKIGLFSHNASKGSD